MLLCGLLFTVVVKFGYPRTRSAAWPLELGSSSIATHVSYGKDSVTYSTFDPEATDVLRLDFVPESVMADGRALAARKDLNAPGFIFDASTKVLRVRHQGAKSVSVQGSGGQAPSLYVTFDDPHLAAGTQLERRYPSGIIDWEPGAWQISVPHGKFGTFNLSLVDPKAETARFRFYAPRIFVGIDAYNGGSSEAGVTVHSPNVREVSFTIKPGELRRIRTGWRDASSEVVLDLKNGAGLRFDNLAYRFE